MELTFFHRDLMVISDGVWTVLISTFFTQSLMTRIAVKRTNFVTVKSATLQSVLSSDW